MGDNSSQETEKIITSVLTSNPLRMTIRDLDRQFSELVGYRIPFRELGFNSLETYLRSIPHCLQIMGQGYHAEICLVVHEKSAHVDSLIQKQQLSKKRRSSTKRLSVNSHDNRKNNNNSFSKSNFTQNRTPIPDLTTLNINPYVPINLLYNATPQRHIRHQLNQFVNQRMPQIRPLEVNKNVRMLQTIQKQSPYKTEYSNNVASSPSLNTSYSEANKNDRLQHQKKSPINTENARNVASSSHLTSSGVIPKNKVTTSTPIQKKIDDHLPRYIQMRLKELIKRHPDGLHCNKIPDMYKKQFNHNLIFYEYGYKSMTHFCLELSSIFACKRLRDGTVTVYDKDLNLQLEDEPESNDEELNIAKWNSSPRTTEPALPDDVDDVLLSFHRKQLIDLDVAIDTNIVRQWIGSNVGLEHFIEIEISEVYNPSKFWIQLCSQLCHLNKLMDEIQMFYQTHKEKYRIPVYAIKEGMFVVSVFEKEYHRAKIVDASKKKEGQVKVFYIDYGTIAIVGSKTIYYLTNKFTSFPAQAIRGRLYGVEPIERDSLWPTSVSNRFLSLVQNVQLVGQIYQIDEENMILDLLLANTTNQDRDIFINDVLIKENLAVFANEVSTSSNYSMPSKNVQKSPDSKKGLTPVQIVKQFLQYKKLCKT